ncbi:MAG TPA: histidine kinase [Flavisolibacter sp.]|nr:histidine kinase [Flavisolibacter sp.]
MDPLQKRLLKTAFMASPLLALYGITPVYLFKEHVVTVELALGVFCILLPAILSFWLINIKLLTTEKIKKIHHRYLLSYAATSAFQLILSLIAGPPKFDEASNLPVIYPVLFILAINTMIIITCNSIILSHKKKKTEQQMENLRISHLEAQKKALTQQLHPHFLFNALSVLKSLIKENPDEAENYSVKLSEFLRYSIEAHKNNLVTVAEELQFTTDYIDLQKVRFQESLVYQIDIDESLFEYMVPAFALQTLVENAIKHNSFTERKPLYIKVAYKDGNIIVRNNKLLSKVSNSTGLGLSNLNDRYEIIAGKKIVVKDSFEEFQVSVPLLKSNQQYENSHY